MKHEKTVTEPAREIAVAVRGNRAVGPQPRPAGAGPDGGIRTADGH